MIDINKKYRTRDGRPVELLTTSGRGEWPVVGYVGDLEDLIRWSLDGANNSYSRLHVFDLVEVKPKRVMWLNVYPVGNPFLGNDVFAHNSREDADEDSTECRIACLKIEFEEGEGLC